MWFLLLLVVPLASGRAWALVTVAVDPTANSHPISPLIYGMNFPTMRRSTARASRSRGGEATRRPATTTR